MPAAYSIDLRQRILNAYEAKEGSQRTLAKRFQVSLSFVKRLIRRSARYRMCQTQISWRRSDRENCRIRFSTNTTTG
jgi:transposase